jgi:hypothetical protein
VPKRVRSHPDAHQTTTKLTVEKRCLSSLRPREPGDSESVKSGSAGGREEKDLPRQTPRRAADPTAWQNAFYRLARCYERRTTVIDAFFDLADTIITVRSPIRQTWTTHRWDTRPRRRP